MINYLKILNYSKNKAIWLFISMAIVILLLSLSYWSYELKPRLLSESLSNLQVVSTSQAKVLESKLLILKQDATGESIKHAINEILLLTEPVSGENLFVGVELEVDYDVISITKGALDISLGDVQCQSCVKTQSPIYSNNTGELLAIIKIYSNPSFYTQLINDVRDGLIINITMVLLVIFFTGYLSYLLFKKLDEREKSLTHEISERKHAEKKLRKFATYDQLTNLPNRYLLQIDFIKKLKETRRYNKQMAILFFDLDRFKDINDIYGHEIGDMLLQEVTKRISKLVRNYDLLARFGGDEFVLIMPNLEDLSVVHRIVNKIIQSFEKDYTLNELRVKVTTSIGISIYPEDGETQSELIKNADLAMYQAKAIGRNGYSFFTKSLNESLQFTHSIEGKLKQAITNNELELYFQPQFNTSNNEVTTAEVLLRWPQKDGSFIQPDIFIPIAENSGLISDLTFWIFDQACIHQQNWGQNNLKDIRVDINFSAKDFLQEKLTDHLLSFFSVKENVNKIGIEITENIFLKATPKTISFLSKLNELQVHISIDDFGTGYSSLQYIKNFPVNCLKIDRSFISNLPNKEDKIIVKAIIAIASGFNMTVTAEGVETEDQDNVIKQVGCDKSQGYLMSKALPADEFELKYLIQKSKS